LLNIHFIFVTDEVVHPLIFSLNPEEFAFTLLPLRHSKNYEKILFVIKETILKIKANPKELEYKRFLKATLERYIKLNDDVSQIILEKKEKRRYLELRKTN